MQDDIPPLQGKKRYTGSGVKTTQGHFNNGFLNRQHNKACPYGVGAYTMCDDVHTQQYEL